MKITWRAWVVLAAVLLVAGTWLLWRQVAGGPGPRERLATELAGGPGPRERLAAELAACREAGMVIDRAWLIPPPVAADENAAPLYAEAAALLGTRDTWPEEVRSAWQTVKLRLGDATWDEPTRREADLVLAHGAAALARMAEAAARPQCRFLIDYTATVPSLDVMPIIDLARLEQMRCHRAADRGDGATALAALGELARLGRALDDGPSPLSCLAGEMIDSLVGSEIGWLLDRGLMAGAELEAAASLLPQRAEMYRRMQRAVNAELVFIYLPLLDGVAGQEDSLGGRMMVSDVAVLTAVCRQQWQLAGQPYCQAPQPVPDEALREQLSILIRGIGVIPIQPALIRRDTSVAMVEMARMALGLERRRAETGSYPSSLAELPPPPRDGPWPADPFSGIRYRYERAGEGFRLWSVGADQEDQGGDAERDIVLRVKAPEAGPAAVEGAPPGPPGEPSTSSWRTYWQERMNERQGQEGQGPSEPSGAPPTSNWRKYWAERMKEREQGKGP